MKIPHRVAIAVAAFAFALNHTTLAAAEDAPDIPPAADALMRSVVAQLPPGPLVITGELVVRMRGGIVLEQYPFACTLHWGATPAVARYALPASGTHPREEITLTRTEDARQITYNRGEPPVGTAPPPLTTPIRNSDLCWLDLTLDFLWWHHPTIVDDASVRGFDCYVVELPRPADMEAEYAIARLWISKQQHLLLQAEGVSAKGDVVRRLWVKSCKKIDEKWMIKEMEIQQYPVVHRTKLRILEVIEPTI